MNKRNLWHITVQCGSELSYLATASHRETCLKRDLCITETRP